MTLDALIMLLGTFVAILPFLGFPNSSDSVLLVIAGSLIVILGIMVRRRAPKAQRSITSKGADDPALDLSQHGK